ncbi:hypothetical protein [Natronoglycomyces albus]|uniref:Uncharacterized protein n=1 Tax=Natronoglycomyces albus TaxID=2811108 RepID=A0A895XTG9_9ACTN|nr:hypothetical protein [Natronoglycomyces albus]QSB05826.1 hypothetical protein JQS30_02550 [Natronoglycomyces albus]
MDVLQSIVVFLHLLGMAMIFGPWAMGMLEKKHRTSMTMVIGAATQLATGIMLAGLAGADGNHAKIGIKAVLALLLAIMIVVPWYKKREKVASGHFYGIGGLTIITVAIAVLW